MVSRIYIRIGRSIPANFHRHTSAYRAGFFENALGYGAMERWIDLRGFFFYHGARAKSSGHDEVKYQGHGLGDWERVCSCPMGVVER